MAKLAYTDQELVMGCLKGKPEHQTALYQRFARVMLGICIRYSRDRMEAEDILQQGFMKVFNNLKNYNGGSLEGWMKRIFVREAIDQYRKTNRSVFGYSQEPEDHHAVDLHDIVGQMAADEIIEMIGTLPEGCRMVFNLFAIEGYTHQEIGEILGISNGTSKAQYFRAKELLRERIYAR
jgi:RNA polymerase sigma factor (sigma-70 family)